MRLDQLIQRLKGVKRNGKSITACCPAHRDNQNSLSIWFIGDAPKFKCDAGCSLDSILKAMSLDKKDVYTNDISSQDGSEHQINIEDQQGPMLKNLSKVSPQEMKWLWDNRIPLGVITGLEGHPQAGKSWIIVEIASALSIGNALPDNEQQLPCNSLILNSEDSAEYVMRKRFEAAGADLTRINVIDEPLRLDEKGLAILSDAIDKNKAKLVVLDPLSSFLPQGVDPNKVERVRPFLAKLMALAKQKDCAIVVVRHLTKHRQSRAMLSGSGSTDFVAAYRSLLLAGSDPDDESKRALIQTKSNYGPLSPSIGYQIVENHLVWTGPTDLTPQRLMSSQRDETKMNVATQDLIRLLNQHGTMPSREVKDHMSQIGHSPSTINRAANNANVQRQRDDFQGQVNWSIDDEAN